MLRRQITFGPVVSDAQASSRQRMLRLVLLLFGVDGVVVVASFREGLEARVRGAMEVVLEAVEVAVLEHAAGA